MERHLAYGAIRLDKPAGPTSHEVVAWVKRILGLGHAGHAGTLDPKVTGVLPVALLHATKALNPLVSADKEYVCIVQLHSDVSADDFERVRQEFTGPIYQRPPVRSSVKRETRVRTIRRIDVEERSGRQVLMRVSCQAGTYVRKLVGDMGLALGCGAHMVELRRTRSGPIAEQDGLATLQDLSDAFACYRDEGDERYLRNVVVPVETVLSTLLSVFVRDSAVAALCHGAGLAIPGILGVENGIAKGSPLAILTGKAELIALGRSLMTSAEMVEKDHGLAVKVVRVIMEPDTYPKMWKKG